MKRSGWERFVETAAAMVAMLWLLGMCTLVLAGAIVGVYWLVGWMIGG